MKHLFRKPAFTLAEVLITLVIIGVIAAATIPTLLQKHQEQELVVKLKKNFSVLSNAYLQAIRENGAPDEWDIGTGSKSSFAGAEKLYHYLKPYLKVSKECGIDGGCFPESYKALFADSSKWTNLNTDTLRYKFILDDGTSVAIFSTNTGCQNSSTETFYQKICGNIHVDLNNKKGPNKAGVDLFFFRPTEKGIVPAGVEYPGLKDSNNRQCTYENTDQYNGTYCAPHVIYKGNMDYLRRHIEDEWNEPQVQE